MITSLRRALQLVFVLLAAEFAIVHLTSSLTLSILGILKELLTILLAAATHGDHLTPVHARLIHVHLPPYYISHLAS